MMPSPFHKQALVFMGLQYKSFENTVGKGEIARDEQFLLYPQSFLPVFSFFPESFLPVWRYFFHFYQIHNYRLQSFSVWKSLKFVVWERVKGPCLVQCITEILIGPLFAKVAQ